jgi:hypothetical protein
MLQPHPAARPKGREHTIRVQISAKGYAALAFDRPMGITLFGVS